MACATSLTRDRTRAPAVEAQNLNHWTAGKVKSCVVLCLTFRSVANFELIF